MKKVEMYECELCGSLMETEERANKCEEAHRTIDTIEICDAQWNHKEVSNYGYPNRILVEIPKYSGVLAEYVFVEEGPCENFYQPDELNTYWREEE